MIHVLGGGPVPRRPSPPLPTSSFVHVRGRRSAHPFAAWLVDALGVSPEPHDDAAPACRVVVVDADRRVRRDLAGLVDLGEGCSCVGVAGDAEAALDLIRRVDPDVVVLDPRLPDVATGLALVSGIRSVSAARIVVLGDDPALGARVGDLGADAFVAKDAQLSPLVLAILRPEDHLPRARQLLPPGPHEVPTDG